MNTYIVFSGKTATTWKSFVRYDHVAKSDLRKHLAKDTKILRLSGCRKISQNPSFCVCLVSLKQINLELRANIRITFRSRCLSSLTGP